MRKDYLVTCGGDECKAGLICDPTYSDCECSPGKYFNDIECGKTFKRILVSIIF
jgi:hypothetical protein